MSPNPAAGKRWWKCSEAEAPAAVFDAVLRCARQNSKRRSDDALFMRMYGARDVIGQGQQEPPKNELDGSLKYNLGRAVVNTAQSAIASVRPKPKFQTDDANWTLVQKAKACEQAVKGVFEANEYYSLSQEVFVDAGVSSLGGIYVYSEAGEVKLERTFPGEILVDVREGYYGKPRTIYRVRLMDKQVLEEKFGITINASGGDRELMRFFDWLTWENVVDQTVVVECWRLGGCDAKGKPIEGKHAICVPGKALTFESFKRKRLPFAFYRWERRQVGFYGCGIVEELRPNQRAVNYLNLKIADMIHNNSRSKVMSSVGADGQRVNVTQLDNDPTTIVHVPFGVNPPVLVTQNAVPSEIFMLRRETIDDGFSQVGLTQDQAAGQDDLGPDASGAAIRERSEKSAKRWSIKLQEFERLSLTTARLIVDEFEAMAEDGEIKPVRVVTSSRNMSRVKLIDWKKNRIDDNEFSLDLTSASSLPDSTAGRTQTVTDWLTAGLIDKQEAKALLDHPDLEAYRSLDLSSYDCILDTIERIVEDGEYFPPEPTDDLALAEKLITQSYNKFRLRRLSRDRLDMILDYLEDVQAMAEQAAMASAQAAPQQISPEQQAMPPGAEQPALASAA